MRERLPCLSVEMCGALLSATHRLCQQHLKEPCDRENVGLEEKEFVIVSSRVSGDNIEDKCSFFYHTLTYIGRIHREKANSKQGSCGVKGVAATLESHQEALQHHDRLVFDDAPSAPTVASVQQWLSLVLDMVLGPSCDSKIRRSLLHWLMSPLLRRMGVSDEDDEVGKSEDSKTGKVVNRSSDCEADNKKDISHTEQSPKVEKEENESQAWTASVQDRVIVISPHTFTEWIRECSSLYLALDMLSDVFHAELPRLLHSPWSLNTIARYPLLLQDDYRFALCCWLAPAFRSGWTLRFASPLHGASFSTFK